MSDFPTYPAGLRLNGRKVVVVGGGAVAQRRIPGLIAAGALVTVVSPDVTPAIEGLGAEITWIARDFQPSDLDACWYVIAATDDHDVNTAVGRAAEERHTFCVRADSAAEATSWTPSVGHHDGITVAVMSDGGAHRNPRRTAALRDDIVAGLQDGRIEARAAEAAVDHAPGVVLVGGGPGDPDLITVAGRKALLEADVVVADRLAPRELLGLLREDAELIDVAKLPRGRSATQEFINTVIVEKAREGKRVVRYKGGDNFVFGRGFEEIIACRAAGIPVRVIPGLTSPVSVPGLAGIPVTHRGVTHEFTVISGHIPPGHPESLVNWPAVAQMRGTVVLMMAVENAPAIASALVAGGRPGTTPVGVICDGSMPTERTVFSTLATLAEDLRAHQVKPPAIIVIGDVVRLAQHG